MKIYHATPIKNLESIREYGLHSTYDGIYFSENAMSALKWVSLGKGGQYAVIEIDIKGRTGLKPGTDHAPIMEFLFPGKVWVSKRARHEISKVLVYDVELDSSGKAGMIKLKDTIEGFVANNTTDNPFKKKDYFLEYEEIVEKIKKHLAEQE
jgi:hypothetical protein